MLGRRNNNTPPTRTLTGSVKALPLFGPEALGLTPRLSPSDHCSWCGIERTTNTKDLKVCATCDTTPATFT